MKTITKGLVGTVAAGAMAMAAATPAQARDRDRDGIGAGEVIAGALIIGGIAAAAGAFDNDDDRYRDRRYRDGRYRDGRYYNGDRYDRRGYRGLSQRDAINMCVRAAERDASRYAYGRAQVTDIRDVDRERGGWEVKGRLYVDNNSRNWRRGRNYDEGRFTCEIRRGRVTDIDYGGIRGL